MQVLVIVCYIFMAVIPVSMSNVTQIAYTASIAFSGMNSAGIVKSAVLVACQYVNVIMAAISCIASVSILILPVIVSLAAPNNTHDEWSRLFYFTVALVFACITFFAVFGEAKAEPWTKVEVTEKPEPSAPMEVQNSAESSSN
ncbi:hypothetical protein AB6A40_009926 [Gnathostoma spinigerum]|uniref:Uncharacterized protein n=1 Tax=Gnathostoma spinigerum TaxID=75299 RepID=A0ABD6EVT5_9BILA